MAPERPVVSKRSGGRRGKGRKRRPAAAGVEQSAPVEPVTGPGRPARRAMARDRARAARERPPAPWHPLPLSELLIFIGAVAVAIAWLSGITGHYALLGVGLAAVAIGTLEVAYREHMSGFRSHTVLLAVIPPLVLHTAVLLGLAGFIRVPRWVNFPLLAIDLALFTFLFKYLRRRHVDARRERVFAAGGR